MDSASVWAWLSSSTSSATSSVIDASSSLRCLTVRSPATTCASIRILMLTSWSEQSTPAAVVDGVRVEQHAVQRRLDAPPLGEPEVAALDHHGAAQVDAVDPDGVVGAVADLGVGLRRGLDVGADPAVPEQVDGRLEDGAQSSSLGVSALAAGMSRARCAPPRTAGSTWPSGATRRPRLRSGCGRSRPSSSGEARRAAAAPANDRAGSGSGSMKMCRWSNAATRRR